ncbi:MAG: potassium/proton antiporter [Deltaproteobacteria bacterium]|nr:potassium/proton antiporter [Deltaproteobacteria bacterium]
MSEPEATAAILAAVGLLILLAGVASPLSRRMGVPALLLFLLLGMVAGSEGLGRIDFGDYGLAYRLGTIALVLILFDGGLNTSPGVLRRAARPAGWLATVSVVATAALMAGFGIALGLEPRLALLAGAVVSSTDAAAVFSVLRGSGVRLNERTAAILEVESGLNDPMAVFLTIVATDYALGERLEPTAIGGLFAQQVLVGAAVGFACGRVARAILPRLHLPAAGLYPVVTLAAAFLSFGAATLLGGSGFLSVYLTGILIPAGAMPYRAGVRRVHDALAWLAQILMFTLLGLLVFPSQLVPVAGVGLALAVLLACVARPLAVWPVMAALGLPRREQGFVAWVGLRGAVPIILAAYPVVRGVEGGAGLFHLVFFVVLVSSLVPGATVVGLARRLGLVASHAPSPSADVELVSLHDFPGEFVWYYVDASSAVAGADLRSLSLPEGCLVTLIVRGHELVVAKGSTALRPGDHVCVFVPPAERGLLDLLFGGSVDEVG